MSNKHYGQLQPTESSAQCLVVLNTDIYSCLYDIHNADRFAYSLAV